jgi:hypothetical protein
MINVVAKPAEHRQEPTGYMDGLRAKVEPKRGRRQPNTCRYRRFRVTGSASLALIRQLLPRSRAVAVRKAARA